MNTDFEQQLEQASRAITFVLRRYAVGVDEAEEFRSWATVRLIEDDYRILRQFEGRSKLSTFLATVVTRLFLDYRNAEWGKWRPSAAAKRAGEVAVQLEALVYRDGHTLSDAIVLLRERTEVERSDGELETLFASLRPKLGRSFRGGEATSRLIAEESTERSAIDRERAEQAETMSRWVEQAFADLDATDVQLLRLRFLEGMQVSAISRMMGLEQRPLYATYERLLRRLRSALEERGATPEQVKDLFAWDRLGAHLDFDGRPAEQASEPGEAEP